MRRILNLFLTGLILFLGSKMFPDIIIINSLKTLLIASVLYWILNAIVKVALFLISLLSLLEGQILTFIITLVGISLGGAVTLNLMSTYLPGFAVIGVFSKIILAFIIGLFTIGKPEED